MQNVEKIKQKKFLWKKNPSQKFLLLGKWISKSQKKNAPKKIFFSSHAHFRKYQANYPKISFKSSIHLINKIFHTKQNKYLQFIINIFFQEQRFKSHTETPFDQKQYTWYFIYLIFIWGREKKLNMPYLKLPSFKTAISPSHRSQFDPTNLTATQKLTLSASRIFGFRIGTHTKFPLKKWIIIE